jgi:Domain of unknown function (DUF6930)
MKIPSCPLPVWKKLYDAADAFREIACWEWMSDSDLFGVQNPETGEIGYCCVLGELREVLGLVVYLGTEGLEQHRKIQSGKLHAGSPEFIYQQHCLTAWFGDRNDLDKTDLKVVKELGLKFRGSDAWPQFRSMQPGYIPWYLSESEAKFLTLCLEQARQVALDFERDPKLLHPPGKKLYLVRVQGEKTAVHSASPSLSSGQQTLFPDEVEFPAHAWNSQWVSPAPLVKAAVSPFPIDELRLQRIKKNIQAHHGIWEIDTFYTPAPVDGSDRPFFPYTLLCADQSSGLILGTVLAEPSTWQREFPKTFLDSIEGHKLLPQELSFRKEELRELIEPLANQLGIEVNLTKRLPAVDRAKRELLKFMDTRH